MNRGPLGRPLVVLVPEAGMRGFYAVLATVAGLLIGATALSDLQAPIVANPVGRQLDLKLEANAAVWFSSLVLAMAAATSAAIGFGCAPTVVSRRLWLLIAVFFLGISIDETAQLHERMGTQFTTRFGTVSWLTEGTLPAFAWLLVLAPLILVFIACVIAALRTWPSLDRRSRRLVIAGLGCWIGVLAAESVQAQLMRWSLERSLQGVVEEGLELAGALLFLAAFIEVLRSAHAHHLPATDYAPHGSNRDPARQADAHERPGPVLLDRLE